VSFVAVAGGSDVYSQCYRLFATSLRHVGYSWRHCRKKFVMRFGGAMDSPKLADLGIQAMTSPIHLRIQHANIYAIDKAFKTKT
jgi:hypothetical protein